MRASKAFETLKIHRFLRKKSIDRLVLALSILLIALTILMMTLTALSITRESQESISAIASFNASIKPLEDSLNKKPEPQTKVPDYAPIVSRAVFGQIGAPPEKKTQDANQKPVSTLPLTLIGTFLSDGQEPYAIIEEQKKKSQDVFLLNDMIFGDAKLVAVYADHVDISRNGKIETLTLEGSPEKSNVEIQGGVGAVGTDEFVVEETELDRALENLPLLLTQARAVPYFKEGKAVGLRLFAIKGGSLFEKIGLQNGDVLKSVNGNSLADLSQAMQLFQKLKEEKSITVGLERNMVEKEFKYQIK